MKNILSNIYLKEKSFQIFPYFIPEAGGDDRYVLNNANEDDEKVTNNEGPISCVIYPGMNNCSIIRVRGSINIKFVTEHPEMVLFT